MSEPLSKRIMLDIGESLVGNESAAFMDSSSFSSAAQQAVVERIAHGHNIPTVFQKITVEPHEQADGETAELCRMLGVVAALRSKWLFAPIAPDPNTVPHTRPFDPFHTAQTFSSRHLIDQVGGVFQVFAPEDVEHRASLFKVPSVDEFYTDLKKLMKVVEGPAKSLAFARLQLLSKRFEMHLLLNETSEIAAVKLNPKRDFYNVSSLSRATRDVPFRVL